MIVATASYGRGVSPDDLIGLVDLGIADGPHGAIAMSPDGTLVAIEVRQAVLEHNSMRLRWELVPTWRGPVIDAGSAGEPIVAVANDLETGAIPAQVPAWTPDSQWFIYKARHEGQVQLWRTRRDGKTREQLTRNPGDVESFRLTADGRRIFFLAGPERAIQAAARMEEGHRGYLYDRRSAPFHSWAPLARAPGKLWVLEIERKLEYPANEKDTAEYQQLTQARRSDKIWLEPAGAGLTPPQTLVTPASRCPHAACTGYFRGLWPSDDGKLAYFLRWARDRDYGPVALYSWGMGADAPRQLLITDDSIEGCARQAAALICAMESATAPRKLVRIDLATASVATLYDPNPHFETLKFGEVTPLYWNDADGVEGFGHLVKPLDYRAGQRYPLVVVQYRSRGFLRGGIGDEYPIHAFASHGFAVLSFHRPDDWELESSAASFDESEERGWQNLRDRRLVRSVLEAGIEHLSALGIVDPRAIGITGFSDGAETVNFMLIHSPRRFAAAAASASFWNPVLYFVAGPRFQPQVRSYGLMLPQGTGVGQQWHDISLALNARKVQTPLLIQVADHELLPATQAFDALEEAAKPVEMYVFADEYHVKAQPRHRYNIYRRNLQWFRFWLQGVEEADPVDPDQYVRWRKLRERRDAGRD